MLYVTFEMFILHNIKEYFGNLYSPCPYISNQKGEFIIFSFTRLLYVCLMVLIIKESVLSYLRTISLDFVNKATRQAQSKVRKKD